MTDELIASLGLLLVYYYVFLTRCDYLEEVAVDGGRCPGKTL